MGSGIVEKDAEVGLGATGGGSLGGTDAPPTEATMAKSTRGYSREFVSGLSYCVMSTTMVLMNKHALSSFRFQCPNSLLFFQCALCCVLVKLTEAVGLITIERLSWRIVRLWLPVNVLFVLMIWSSFFALKFLNVAMVTVLKNLTNLITICGDYTFNHRRYPLGVWVSLFLMLVSAVAGAYTDLTFSMEGYLWQLANCVATASYSLYLRSVIDKVQVRKGIGMPRT
jgi:GDP-mannose transporter